VILVVNGAQQRRLYFVDEYRNGLDHALDIRFPVRRSRGEIYTGHGVRVCLSVPRRIPTLLHGPGYNLRNGRGAL